jgi:cleavage stimulation factor subunit 2
MQTQSSNQLPPLPEGRPPPANVPIPNAISQTLQAYPTNQLVDIISQLKAVTNNNPEQAKQLLMTLPQLAYAVFQAILMRNLVDTSVLQQVVGSMGQPTQSVPPAGYQRPFAAAAAPVDPQKMALIQQVMSLTEDQINLLVPEQRTQILQSRQQVMAGQI